MLKNGMLTYTPAQVIEYGLIAGPVWHDACDHGQGTYVTSFQTHHFAQGPKSYDLYIFDQPTDGQEVCIRYGNEGGEYISPGQLGEFLIHSQGYEPYETACRILLVFGKVSWMSNSA